MQVALCALKANKLAVYFASFYFSVSPEQIFHEACKASRVYFSQYYFVNGVTSLTFWGYVTSSVTWPFDHSTPGGRLPMGDPYFTKQLLCRLFVCMVCIALYLHVEN